MAAPFNTAPTKTQTLANSKAKAQVLTKNGQTQQTINNAFGIPDSALSFIDPAKYANAATLQQYKPIQQTLQTSLNANNNALSGQTTAIQQAYQAAIQKLSTANAPLVAANGAAVGAVGNIGASLAGLAGGDPSAVAQLGKTATDDAAGIAGANTAANLALQGANQDLAAQMQHNITSITDQSQSNSADLASKLAQNAQQAGNAYTTNLAQGVQNNQTVAQLRAGLQGQLNTQQQNARGLRDQEVQQVVSNQLSSRQQDLQTTAANDAHNANVQSLLESVKTLPLKLQAAALQNAGVSIDNKGRIQQQKLAGQQATLQWRQGLDQHKSAAAALKGQTIANQFNANQLKTTGQAAAKGLKALSPGDQNALGQQVLASQYDPKTGTFSAGASPATVYLALKAAVTGVHGNPNSPYAQNWIKGQIGQLVAHTPGWKLNASGQPIQTARAGKVSSTQQKIIDQYSPHSSNLGGLINSVLTAPVTDIPGASAVGGLANDAWNNTVGGWGGLGG